MLDVQRATSYKMHDLELVAIMEFSRWPIRSRHDLQVQLHGNAVRLHSQSLDQGRHVEAVGEFLPFAVHLKEHGQDCTVSSRSCYCAAWTTFTASCHGVSPICIMKKFSTVRCSLSTAA